MNILMLKLRSLKPQHKKELMDSASEVFRAVEEFDLQMESLVKELDKDGLMLYNETYIGKRVSDDLEFYRRVDEAFRKLALDTFDEGDME